MSTRYTNIGISGGAVVGTTVPDSEKQYSNTGSAVYAGGNSVTPADLGFTGDVSDLWIRFDLYTYKISNPIKILFYLDGAGGSNHIGLYGYSGYYGVNGSTSFGINSELFNKTINKVVFHVSSTAFQIYVNDVAACDKTGINNGTKITSMSFLSEIITDSTTSNNNMFSNIIIADYDCSQETLAEHTDEPISVTNHYDMARAAYSAEAEYADIARTVSTSGAAKVRYTNRGIRDVLLNSGDNARAPENESKTGVEVQFGVSSHSISLADIGFTNPKELWMRFDIFCRGGDGGIGLYCDDEETYGNRTTANLFFGYAEIRKNMAYPATTDYTYKLYTFRIHVTSQSLTVYKDDILQYSFSNTSLSSLPIRRIGIYPGNSFISNVIIANYDCTQETLATNGTPISDKFDLKRTIEYVLSTTFDLSRKLSNTESVKFDLSRTVTDEQTISAKFDLSRIVSKSISEPFDLKRIVSSNNIHITEPFDLARNVSRTISEKFDLSRNLSQLVVVQRHSTEREVYFNLVQNHSTWRSVNGTVSIRFDTCVKNNNVFSYTGDSISIPGNMRLASFAIEISESSVSDKITLGIVNSTLNPLNSVKGKLLDYDYDMLVQSTQQQGILSTVQTMLDWKKVTGTVLRYPDFDGSGKAKSSSTTQSPRVLLDHIGGDIRIWATGAGSIDSSKKTPTTKASYHLDYLAQAMGYSSCEKYFDDFTPSNGCANESASYISLISNFFSWTKDIPWHEINVFGRGNILYAVQRGHEPNTVDITSMRHTVPTVLREAVMIYKAKIKVDNSSGSTINLDVSKEEGEKPSKDRDGVKSYNTGNASHNLGYDKSGRPLKHVVKNPDGSTDTIEYDYSESNDYVDVVHEIHIHKDKKGKETKTEVWHTDIGHGHEVTDGSDEKGNITGSALTTNRTNAYSTNGTGDKYTFTASVGDSNTGAVYIADDTYGNHMQWTTGDDGSDSDPFPIVGGGYDYFDEIKAYNGNKVQETLTLDIMSPVRNGVPDYKHIIDYRDAVVLDGNKYYLVSNSVDFTTKEFKQSLKIIRWA